MNILHGKRTQEIQEREALRAQFYQEELVERIARALPEDGRSEPAKGLRLIRASAIKEPVHGVTSPAFCVIAQGVKEMHLGEDRYRYDPHHYLLTTVKMPVVAQLIEASSEKPYLSLLLDLDAALVASVMLEAGMPSPKREAQNVRAIDVSPLDEHLQDAVVRLVRLLDLPPNEARVLLPLITREIVLRLLIGEQSARLRHIAQLGGHTDRIARAVERLRHTLDQPLRMDTLARELGMSTSGFHEHFKAVTAMSPLQFQKQLRLQEARRLLLGEGMDATTVAYRVGYDDASHFSREYKRLFGAPPMRDVERVRLAARAEV